MSLVDLYRLRAATPEEALEAMPAIIQELELLRVLALAVAGKGSPDSGCNLCKARWRYQDGGVVGFLDHLEGCPMPTALKWLALSRKGAR